MSTRIPDDVVIEILARLSAKSVLRAKRVCKRWYKLISDKYLIQLHYDYASTNPSVLFESRKRFFTVDYSKDVSKLSLNNLNDVVKIGALNNGSLCLSSMTESRVFYVCNPITGEVKKLPKSEEIQSEIRIFAASSFDLKCLVGLTEDLSMKRFKVVLLCVCPMHTFVCFIFDSYIGEWRKFESKEYKDDNDNCRFMPGVVFVNGHCNWLMDPVSINWSTGPFPCILSLDLEYGIWSKVQLMDVLSNFRDTSYSSCHLVEFDVNLAVVYVSRMWMRILMMNDYQSKQWCLIDEIALEYFNEEKQVAVPKFLGHHLFPISLTSEHLIVKNYNSVFVYNRKFRTWKELYSINENRHLLAHKFWGTLHRLS